MQDFQPGDIIAEEFQIQALLAQGSFGKVYLGRWLVKNMNVAIKVEKSEVSYYNSLVREVEILKILEGVPQIPKVYWSGQENGMKIMIQNLLGKDLIHYQKKIKKFSYECICSIAYQMIEILEQIHKKNIIHRDLKPENILGASQSDKIYLIDFGIAKNLENSKKSKEKISFIGTTRYASIAAHLGKEQNKKDDLESLGYILIYFLNGQLPWMSVEKDDSERIEKIGLLKQDISPEELCENQPKSILKFLKYVKSLTSKTKPNYSQLKELFKIDPQSSMPFDWNKRPRSNNRMKSNKSIKTSKSAKQYNKSKSQYQKSQNQIPQESSYKFIQTPNQTQLKKQIRTLIFQDNNDKTIYHSSDDNQQNSLSEDKKEKESVKVGYTISYEPSKFSRYSQHNKSPLLQQQRERGRVSTLDSNPQEIFIMPLLSEQQLQECENQDLAYKYNLLYYKSISYNYKNPIQDFKSINFNVYE